MQPVQGLRELLPCSAVSFTEQRALLFWLKIEQQDGTHAAAPASLSHHGHFASRMHAIHNKKNTLGWHMPPLQCFLAHFNNYYAFVSTKHVKPHSHWSDITRGPHVI